MHTGLLWFDNDPDAALSEKIQKAAAYYLKKFGRAPEICLVNPKALEKGAPLTTANRLTVRAYAPVMPNHFWIGVEEKR